MSAESRFRPTDTELSILQVLWEHGPSTVRDVHEKLGAKTGYTTVLKLLQIMAQKGLVNRDEADRAHVYSAAIKRKEVQRSAVKTILQNLFSNSALALVQQALSSKKATPDELAEIRRLLDQMEGKK